MATLSNVDVFTFDASWLVTTRPTEGSPSPAYISAKSGLALPIAVHCTPSLEIDPVISVPDSASFSQTGGCCDAPAMYVVD